MKNASSHSLDFLGLKEADYEELKNLIYEKDYSSEALSFIGNHSRILNYWSEGEYDLLPADPERKRRRFSFLDLVWLGIVKELRDFGMEKAALHSLKKNLCESSSADLLIEMSTNNRKEMETLLARQMGLNSMQTRALVDQLIQKQEAIKQLQASRLHTSTLTVLTTRQPFYFLINKKGEVVDLVEANFSDTLADPEYRSFYRAPHLSVCLNEVVGFFLSKPYIKDSLRQLVFTPAELTLIEAIRKEKPKTFTIHFEEGGKPESYEVTKKVYVELEARLYEIITKKGYHKMELVTKDDKVLYALKTQKHKL